MTQPILFTGDITLIAEHTNLPCRECGDAVVVGVHYMQIGSWLVEDNGLRVLDDRAFRQWQAEREVEETLERWAAEMAA